MKKVAQVTPSILHMKSKVYNPIKTSKYKQVSPPMNDQHGMDINVNQMQETEKLLQNKTR